MLTKAIEFYLEDITQIVKAVRMCGCRAKVLRRKLFTCMLPRSATAFPILASSAAAHRARPSVHCNHTPSVHNTRSRPQSTMPAAKNASKKTASRNEDVTTLLSCIEDVLTLFVNSRNLFTSIVLSCANCHNFYT